MVQTLHSVAKPVFRAFELLRDAGNYTIPVEINDPTAQGSLSAFATVESSAADVKTAGGGGSIAAALRGLRVYIANFKPNMGLPSQPIPLVIRLTGLTAAKKDCAGDCADEQADMEDLLADVKATAYVIDASHANPKATWQGMGQSGSEYGPNKYLNEAELHRLRVASGTHTRNPLGLTQICTPSLVVLGPSLRG